MVRRRRSLPRRLLLGTALALVLAVVVREPLLPGASAGSDDDVHVTRGLGLSPVLATAPGPCPAPPTADTIWASTYDTCLTIGDGGLHVTSVRSAEIVQDGPQWLVRLTFSDPDAAAFAALTTTLAASPAPRDELAIILQGPPGGLVLAAPAVVRPVTQLDVDGGPTRASARSLLDSIVT